MTWQERAACSGLAGERGSYDIFFEQEYEAEAKRICGTCTVRAECLHYAMSHPQVWDGVLGGMTPAERTRAYRRWLHWTKHRERTEEAWHQWNAEDAG